MREFAQPGGRGLAQLQPSTRLLFGLVLVFTLASYVVMLCLGLSRSGWTPASIVQYYAGAHPDEGKSSGELLEITHFHLFSIPMLLFVLGHVFLMCRWPRAGVRLALVLCGFAGAACDLAAPWLVIHVGPWCAWVKLGGRLLLAPALLAMTLIPLWEIARPARPRD